MVLIKNNITIIGVLLLFCTYCKQKSDSNKSEEGLMCCIRPVLPAAEKNESITLTKSISEGVYKIDDKILEISKTHLTLDEKDLMSRDSIQHSIQLLNIDSIKIFTIKFKGRTYILIGSEIDQATGLATNFYMWVLIEISRDNNPIIKVISLCDDSKSIYIKDDQIFFMVFQFGDDFYLKERDFENVPIKITTLKIEDGYVSKIKETEVICECL
jgi:hypothetical protein